MKHLRESITTSDQTTATIKTEVTTDQDKKVVNQPKRKRIRGGKKSK